MEKSCDTARNNGFDQIVAAGNHENIIYFCDPRVSTRGIAKPLSKTNAGLLLTGPLETNFSQRKIFSFMNMHLENHVCQTAAILSMGRWQISLVSGNDFGAVRQQAITWANIDAGLYRHMASLGQNELMWKFWIHCLSWGISKMAATKKCRKAKNINICIFTSSYHWYTQHAPKDVCFKGNKKNKWFKQCLLKSAQKLRWLTILATKSFTTPDL